MNNTTGNPEAIAVIFDLDGVIVDNMDFHRKAWGLFLEKYAPEIDLLDFSRHFGKTNRELLRLIFKRTVSSAEETRWGEEKEAIYRRIYADAVRPLPGLKSFLLDIKKAGFRSAVASAAPRVNVDFVLERLGLRDFFNAVLDASYSVRGKPDPGIYLEAARILAVPPRRCLVFEDSFPGVQAARNAGMTIIGVTTTYSAESLKDTDGTIKDFVGLSAVSIRSRLDRR